MCVCVCVCMCVAAGILRLMASMLQAVGMRGDTSANKAIGLLGAKNAALVTAIDSTVRAGLAARRWWWWRDGDSRARDPGESGEAAPAGEACEGGSRESELHQLDGRLSNGTRGPW